MNIVQSKHWKVISAMLIILLIAAQARAMAHAHEHDADAYQDSVCASCVSANQLSSACVDSGVTLDVKTFACGHDSEHQLHPDSIHGLSARQRGPPVST